MNLLPLHPGGAPGLEPTPSNKIKNFAGRLQARGVEAVVRRSRGLDIKAACGQLAGQRGSGAAGPVAVFTREAAQHAKGSARTSECRAQLSPIVSFVQQHPRLTM